MATREENIQKINAELETMSDEELAMVAGGTKSETEKDNELLYDHGLMDSAPAGSTSTGIFWTTISAEVDAGWSKAGITCVTKLGSNNLYFMDGRQISRDEAYKHVITNFKKVRDSSKEYRRTPLG